MKNLKTLILLLLAFLPFCSDIAQATPTRTTRLLLYKPAYDEIRWDVFINSNSEILDAAIVTGPAVAVDGTPAIFSGTTGKELKAGTVGVDYAPATASPTGIVTEYIDTIAPSGWLMCDGTTIGSATSGATARANADTATLFALIWKWSETLAPIYTSAGVLSTRGASAYADFSANKRLTVPDFRGRVAVGKSTDTEFDAMGETGGAKTHTLASTEMPEHAHGVHLVDSNSGSSHYGEKGTSTSGYAGTGSTLSAGGGAAHNNLQPYITINYIIKL